jgi:cytochrome c
MDKLLRSLLNSRIIGCLVIIGFSMVLVSCGGASSSTSSTSITTSSTITTPVSYAQYSSAGQTVYVKSCASCHGDQGQGTKAPAIIGSNASLSKYNTAKGLLDKISTTMPMSAPGTLSHQEYLQLLAYILSGNKLVAPNTLFSESQLISITLK